MGPLQGVLKMIPGMGKQLEGLDQVDEKQMARVEAIILSMTPQERALPHLIDGRRRMRIANGSGSSVQQVNQLLEARKQMAKMMKGMGKGKMPDLGKMMTEGGGPAAATQQTSLSARPGSAGRKKKKRSKARR
jgi:signal recognition particle subunit SRP54